MAVNSCAGKLLYIENCPAPVNMNECVEERLAKGDYKPGDCLDEYLSNIEKLNKKLEERLKD